MKFCALIVLVLACSVAIADPKDGKHDKDRYQNFSRLKKNYREKRDFRVRVCLNPSGILVAAIHGGAIEPRTAELAIKVAGAQHSLYVFQSLLNEEESWPMHITSVNFDEPRAVTMSQLSHTCLSLHGFGFLDDGAQRLRPAVLIGGRNPVLKNILRQELDRFRQENLTELYVGDGFGRFAGVSPKNYVNRPKNQGAQIEMSRALRDLFLQKPCLEENFVAAVRKSLRAYESCASVLNSGAK